MSNAFLDAALDYAAVGLKVFPLKERGKSPAHTGWQDEATTDADAIRAMWAENPRYNVGIKTGDGLCVLDVDDKPKNLVQGSDMLREWELEHGNISDTVCCKTPTGGMHYYYNIGDVRISGCQSGELKIDIRCDGNLIVAPPSIHPDTGTRYEWDISPFDMEPAKASTIDKQCIEWVYEHRDGATADGKADVSIPQGVLHEGDGRNKFLYTQGLSERGKGGDDAVIRAVLTALNGVKCSPPLPDDELGKIIKSVCTKPVGMSDEAKRSAAKAKTRKFDHAGIAQKLMKEHSMCFIDGMPAIYGNGRYTIGWNAVCREIINLDGSATNSNQKEVIHYLTVMGEHKRQSPPNLIAFENGVLDIETMELREWEPDDIIPNIIPHNWRGMVECKDVDTVLMKMACGDESTYYSLIEVMGVCMYRSAEFTQSAILLGTGSNGKSTYIRMIQALLGYDNISSLDLGALGQQFLTGLVAGKLANLGDDISNKFKDGDKLTVFKKMVDGNRQHADVKNIEGFDFNPYATMVFSCNEFPSLDDYTDGMMRRLFPVEFNAKFSKTDPDYDPRISKKVATEEACERMCWLGVLGLSRVIDNNGFTPTEASTRRVNEILSDNDTTLAWMEDESRDTDWFDNKPVSDAYQDYRIWCDRSGLHAVGRTKFTRRIKARLKLDANVKWHGGKSTRVFEKV